MALVHYAQRSTGSINFNLDNMFTKSDALDAVVHIMIVLATY